MAVHSGVESNNGRREWPLEAIRRHCVECCGDNAKEVRRCQCPDCKLWPYRFGIRPDTARERGLPVGP